MRPEPPRRSRLRHLVLHPLLLLAVAAAAGAGEPSAASDGEEWTPVPLRVRNLTFPTVLVMGFKPAPVTALPRGAWALEVDLSVSNNFQVSPGVLDYLHRRGGPPRALTAADVRAILDSTTGDQFFVDGEIDLLDVGLHYGLTERLALSLQLTAIGYDSNLLDPVISSFHDLLNIGQGGRDTVPEGGFQAFLADKHGTTALLQRPTRGGLGDPVVGLHWAVPGALRGWRFGVQGGVKLPLADADRLLSTGSLDAGVQLSGERRWLTNALVLNLSWVAPGDFENAEGFTPSDLPSLDVAWIHRLGRRTSMVVQALFSESIFRDVTRSAIAHAEFQLTTGLTWRTAHGRLALAMTENLFNYDNTPDFAIHLSYGHLFERR